MPQGDMIDSRRFMHENGMETPANGQGKTDYEPFLENSQFITPPTLSLQK